MSPLYNTRRRYGDLQYRLRAFGEGGGYEGELAAGVWIDSRTVRVCGREPLFAHPEFLRICCSFIERV